MTLSVFVYVVLIAWGLLLWFTGAPFFLWGASFATAGVVALAQTVFWWVARIAGRAARRAGR